MTEIRLVVARARRDGVGKHLGFFFGRRGMYWNRMAVVVAYHGMYSLASELKPGNFIFCEF